MIGISVLNDLSAFLATIPGVGTYDPVGTTGNLFYPQLPAAPPSCLALRPYGGQPPGPRTFASGVPIWDAPLIQIVARDAAYDAADARAQAAYGALSGVAGQLFGGLYCYRITCLQPPSNALGRDASNLWLVSFNCALIKQIA